MQESIPKRYLLISLILYVCSFLFFFVYNITAFPLKIVDSYFKSSWILSRSLLQFFENQIPVQALAVIFTFSVFYPESQGGAAVLPMKKLNQLITLVIVITLCLAAVFFVGNEVFRPRLHGRLDSYEYLTKTSRAYMSQAEEAAGAGRFLEARELLEHYLAIKPGDPAAGEMYKNVSERIANQFSSGPGHERAGYEMQDAANLDYEDALRLARSYLELKDYYSAYYYSRIAAGLASDSEDAKALTSEAWERIRKTEVSAEDAEEFDLFSRKKRGTGLLLSDRPVDAYYLFSRLKIDYPDDPDVDKYLAESLSKARELTYFIDEAENIRSFPGSTGIICLNINEAGRKQLVYIGKMAVLPDGTFFEDIEVIDFVPGHGVTRQVTAPYGKLVGDLIVLNGIDRENRNIRIFPEYHVSDIMPELYNTLKLNVDPYYLHGFDSSGNIYRKLNMIELIEFEPVIAGYGHPAEPLYLEIINRILSPFNFMIISFLMIAFGWKYRRLSGKKAVAALILTPVTVYVTALFSEAYSFAAGSLCSFFYLSFGLSPAILLLILSQAVLLVIMLLLISSMTIRGRGTESGVEV